MTNTTRPTRLNVDLQHYKAPWLAYCRARNITPSAAFRQVAAKLMAGTRHESDDAMVAADAGKTRKEIRLTPAEATLAEAMALREGFSLSRWIVAAVRVRLGQGTQLGFEELRLLGQSNLLLLGLIRQLHRVAKTGSGDGSEDARVNSTVMQIDALVTSHTKAVGEVLTANARRWGRT